VEAKVPPTTAEQPPPVTLQPATIHDPNALLDVRRLLLMPGLGLLICGVLGTMGTMEMITRPWRLGPEGMVRMWDEAMPQMLKPFVPQPSAEELTQQAVLGGVFFLVISLGMVFGAMQMLRLRTYWLAVAGSLLACINIVNCCCVLSAPVGVWSLLVLRMPEVRHAFAAMASGESHSPE
jgi:hypothetical protein